MLFIRAPFYVLSVFVAMCSVFWLFWLSCHYLPSDWLERLFWGSLTMARELSPESPGRRVLNIFLVYCIVWICFIVLLCVCNVPRPYMIYFPTVMAQHVCAESAVKHQANKQTSYIYRTVFVVVTDVVHWFVPIMNALCVYLANWQHNSMICKCVMWVFSIRRISVSMIPQAHVVYCTVKGEDLTTGQRSWPQRNTPTTETRFLDALSENSRFSG